MKQIKKLDVVMKIDYEDDVFINCPFDEDYRPIFNAVIFTVHDAGFRARCALEMSNAAVNRLAKIMDIISECKYEIHDISRTEPDPINSLPRFNMPLELGISLGCRKFGKQLHQAKICMIMDKEPYRYQKFISDIAGQDIHCHNNDPETAVGKVRGWLQTASRRKNIPGGAKIWKRYEKFNRALPPICQELNIKVKELTFVDFIHVITAWLEKNPL